jgi:hypothetical protein
MIYRGCASLAILTLLTACGGGGGTAASNAVIPKTPAKAPTTATFAFALPGKATSARVRRPYYQSQATAGVAIDWNSTDPTHPDYAAAIGAVCPGTLPTGITACTIDALGNTDYTFQLAMLPGRYTFTVSTFAMAPVSGVFTGTVLAQGQLAAPVVISSGTTNTITGLTFYGVPAGVSFVAGPAQSHVALLNGGYAVVGNAPQTFYAQATDAAGFAIASSDSGAPTVTLSEAASDATQNFAIASSSKYAFTLTAEAASPTSVPATITVNAVAGGTGLPPFSTNFAVTAVQELWTTQAGGTGTEGIAGYPLYPPSYLPSTPLDLSNPQNCDGQCDWSWGALDNSGNIWVYETLTASAYVFAQGSGSQGPIAPSVPQTIPFGSSPQAFTIDTDNHIYITNTSSSPGTISIWPTLKAPVLAVIQDAQAEPVAVAVAPSAPNVLAALIGTIWVADAKGISVFTAYTSGVPTRITVSGGPGGAQAVAFDPSGHLWVYDTGGNLDVYTISGSTSAATMSLVAQVPVASTDGANQLGITAQGTAWMGGPGSLNGMYSYNLSGSTLTVGNFVYQNVPSVWMASVVP